MAFIISKLFWLLAAPGNLLMLALCGGAVLMFTRWRGLARWIVGAAAVAVVAIAVLPLGQWLLMPLEERFPAARLPERVDGIVVLGGGINAHLLETRGQAGLNDHAERVFALVELARRYPDATLIYTGGDASLTEGQAREADGARWLTRQLGLDTRRVLFEREARNTYENALYAKPLAEPGPDETWLLVTSAFHMPRSVGIFRAQGWPVIPHPVDYDTDGRIRWLTGPDFAGGLVLLSRGVKEWIGLVAYYALGYTDALFPGPER